MKIKPQNLIPSLELLHQKLDKHGKLFLNLTNYKSHHAQEEKSITFNKCGNGHILAYVYAYLPSIILKCVFMSGC